MMSAFISFILRRRHLTTLGVIHFFSFALEFDGVTCFSHHRFFLLHSECKVDVAIQDVLIKCDKWSVAHK